MWNVDDEVSVRFGNSTFFDAIVKDISRRDEGWYGVDLVSPPTLDTAGLSHTRLPGTTVMPTRNQVQAAACFLGDDAEHHIKDRV